LRIEKARGEPDQKKELGREQIEALIQAASNAPNVFLKHAYLEQAAALTHSRGGSSEDAQRIARLIEASPVRSEDFSRVTTDLEWSREELEALVQPAGSLPSWQAALEWFGSRGPPTGDPKDHLEDVERQKQTAPLQFLVPKVLYGPGGLPLLRAETEEERIEYAVAMNERLALQIWGHIYERILVRVTERSDFPGMGELTEFFSGPLVSMNVADALARAVVHFRAHAFDEAAHVLIPRIEAIVRSVAEAMDIATASLPIGHTQGGYVSLGMLFSRLRPVGLPDEPWRRYGEHLLTDSLGAYLRNEICHGLRPTVSPSEAALLVHYASHLCTLRVGPAAS
jgi:hypothetical protein